MRLDRAPGTAAERPSPEHVHSVGPRGAARDVVAVVRCHVRAGHLLKVLCDQFVVAADLNERWRNQEGCRIRKIRV